MRLVGRPPRPGRERRPDDDKGENSQDRERVTRSPTTNTAQPRGIANRGDEYGNQVREGRAATDPGTGDRATAHHSATVRVLTEIERLKFVLPP
jgi:hypothetical protein